MYQHSFKIIIFMLALCCITLDCNFAYGQKPKPRSSSQQKGVTKDTTQKPVASPKRYTPSGEITFEEFNPYAGSKDTTPVVTLGGIALKKDNYAESGVIFGTEQNCDLILAYTSKSNLYMGTTRKVKQLTIPPTPHSGIDNIYVYFVDPTIKAKTTAERKTYAKNVSFDIIGIGGMTVEVVWYDGFAKTSSGMPKILGSKKFITFFPTRPVRVTIPDNITGFSITPVTSCYICNYGIDNLAFGLPLIAGRLRVVDPKDSNKSWNIDKIPQGQTEKNTTTVSVIAKDSPDKPVMILSVDKEGKFSSLKAIKGSEGDLVNGKEYFLRSSLKYQDYVEVNNEDRLGGGCPVPTNLTRESRRDVKPLIITKGQSNLVNIDYPLPIFLIHGIRSCWQDWEVWATKLLNNKASDSQLLSGYIIFTPTYVFRGISFQAAAEQVSMQLHKDLNNLFSDKPRIDLICYSKGGVVGRAFSKLPNNTFIHKLYTLGSPHSGTFIDPGLGDLFTYELSIEDLLKYNTRYGGFPENIKIFAISGTASRTVPGFSDLFGFITDEEHDGIVLPQKLSHTIYKFNKSANHIDRNKFVVDTEFAYHPIRVYHSPKVEVGHPTFLDQEGASLILDKYVLPDLSNASTQTLTQVSETHYVQVASNSVDIKIPHIPTVISHEVSITPNTPQEVSVPVSTTKTIVFICQSTTKAAFAIIDPEGIAIKPLTAKSYPGAKYETGYLGEDAITIENPKRGNWKISVSSLKEIGKARVAAMITSKWSLVGDSDKKVYSPSSQAVVRAELLDDTSKITAASVAATIKNKSGQNFTSVMLLKKEERVFEGIVNIPSLTDSYHLVFELNGREDGFPVKRQAISTFDVLMKEHLFKEDFSDRIKDTDGNGKADSIIEALAFNVPQDGEYAVYADLFDNNGNYIGHAVETVRTTGKAMEKVTLIFDVSKANCSQFSAPFQIKNLTLDTYKNGYVTLDVWQSPIQTAKYSPLDFGLKCESETKPEPKQGQGGGIIVPPPPPKSNNNFAFSLNGNLKTDVEINAGDSVTISASGQVVLGKRVGGCSPDGRETSIYELGSLIVKGGGNGELVGRHGQLLARINAQGNEKWIAVGSNKTFVAPNSGVLELQVNDKKYEDNQGKFDVQVRIDRRK